MGAVAEDDVEQQDGRGRIAGLALDPLAAHRAVDHGMRPPHREVIVPEIDDAMIRAVAVDAGSHVRQLRRQQPGASQASVPPA